MQELKENYKDDILDVSVNSMRKYTEIDNSDGTISLIDSTTYTQEGDAFGAKEVNAITGAVNRLAGVFLVTLSASAWTGSSAPYSQTVAVEGITAEDEPILVRALSDGATETVQKAYNKAFGILAAGTGTTADGSVTFKVYQKPTTDLTVGLKGV